MSSVSRVLISILPVIVMWPDAKAAVYRWEHYEIDEGTTYCSKLSYTVDMFAYTQNTFYDAVSEGDLVTPFSACTETSDGGSYDHICEGGVVYKQTFSVPECEKMSGVAYTQSRQFYSDICTSYGVIKSCQTEDPSYAKTDAWKVSVLYHDDSSCSDANGNSDTFTEWTDWVYRDTTTSSSSTSSSNSSSSSLPSSSFTTSSNELNSDLMDDLVANLTSSCAEVGEFNARSNCVSGSLQMEFFDDSDTTCEGEPTMIYYPAECQAVDSDDDDGDDGAGSSMAVSCFSTSGASPRPTVLALAAPSWRAAAFAAVIVIVTVLSIDAADCLLHVP